MGGVKQDSTQAGYCMWGLVVGKCLLMIDTSNWKLTNIKEINAAWTSSLVKWIDIDAFYQSGIRSRENVFGEMMNFVFNAELGVPMGYPSGAVPE